MVDIWMWKRMASRGNVVDVCNVMSTPPVTIDCDVWVLTITGTKMQLSPTTIHVSNSPDSHS